MKRLKETIRKKEFYTVYLFYGYENYLKSYYLTQISSALVPKGAEQFNTDTYSEKNATADKIIETSMSYPFMSDKRLIILKDTGLLKSGRKDDTAKLAAFIPQVPQTTTIIFVESEIDKKLKLYKQIEKVGMVTEFKTPTEKELCDWINKIAAKGGKRIDTAASLSIIRNVSNSMDAILTEMEKLIAYKADSDIITTEDVELLCSKTLEAKIFEMVDSIGSKNAEKALTIYSNLLMLKESPIAVLSMVARQFRIILQVKSLQAKGLSVSDIGERLSLRGFVIKNCLTQAKNFKESSLKNALNDCLQTDIDIKTGRISPELGVELIIATYSSII